MSSPFLKKGSATSTAESKQAARIVAQIEDEAADALFEQAC